MDAGVRGEAAVVAIFDRNLNLQWKNTPTDSNLKMSAERVSSFGASPMTCDASRPIRSSVLLQILSYQNNGNDWVYSGA